MNHCTLGFANLENLTALWHALGATQMSNQTDPFWMSDSWPHKCWTSPQTPQTPIDAHLLERMNERLIFPLWGLSETAPRETAFRDAGYTISSEQTAMLLPADEWVPDLKMCDNTNLQRLYDGNDAGLWSRVCAEAFDYPIDPAPIRKLLQDKNADVYLATIDGVTAGTALLYRTGDITGVHQVGVVPAFRGRGLAGAMMETTINAAFESGARYVTLQASVAGKPLYDQLGFREQFNIRNYTRGSN